MQDRSTFAPALVALALALAAVPVPSFGQAVTDPNQIVGVVRLATTNPEILDALRDPPGLGEGIEAADPRRYVQAVSTGGGPQLSHVTEPLVVLPGRDRANYDLTVESSVAGIAYEVSARLWLDGGNDDYVLTTQLSAPVLPDPAPDVVRDLTECAGMLDITWVLDTGGPFYVDGGYVVARRETSPGSGSFEAQANVHDIGAGQDQERLVVHGGADFDLEIRAYITYGSDPELDLGHFEVPCDQAVHVDCDEVERIVCVIPTGSGGGSGCGIFGRIAGRIDMLGEDEIPFPGSAGGGLTVTHSWDGPQGNERWFTLRSDPSSGDFRHENLLAWPPGGTWRFESGLVFGEGYDAERFTPPKLGSGLNPRVPVEACLTTDLADTYVMDPGRVTGLILLAGPRTALGGPIFDDLRRDMDGNPGRPGSWLFTGSLVGAAGRNVLAPGATHSAAGGSASVGFSGGPTSNHRSFVGRYNLRLGGLDGASSVWNPGSLSVLVRDVSQPAVPVSFRDSHVFISDRMIPDTEIAPGSITTFDRRYCFSQVLLEYRSTSGTFYQPRLDASGQFVGTDFLSLPADQQLAVHAEGTPVDQASAAATGMVVMALPQGTYDITPHVTSVSPRGVDSQTELPPLSFPVGCRQLIKLTSALIPQMDGLPDCTTVPTATVSGSFQSRADVARVSYRLNGGPPVDLCTSCGVSPAFSFDVTWQPCENEITVDAEDVDGVTAFITGSTSLDAEAPRVEADAFALWPPDHKYACFTNVLDAVRATDNCPGELQYQLTGCRSDQPDDAQGPDDSGVSGDGDTTQDCVVADDGSGACIRAERLGQCPAGRTYVLTVHVTDSCGLSTDAEVRFVVPHDDPKGAGLPDATPTIMLGPHDAIPFAYTPAADPDAGLPVPYACPAVP